MDGHQTSCHRNGPNRATQSPASSRSIDAEATALTRAAGERYTFPKNAKTGHVLVNVSQANAKHRVVGSQVHNLQPTHSQTNLMVVLDISGSMADASGITATARLKNQVLSTNTSVSDGVKICPKIRV